MFWYSLSQILTRIKIITTIIYSKKNVCVNYILYISLESMFLKILMLIRQVREYIICYYWYILDKGFKPQPGVFGGCRDVLLMSLHLNDIAIPNISGEDYRCIISGTIKYVAINLMQNLIWLKNAEHYKKYEFIFK